MTNLAKLPPLGLKPEKLDRDFEYMALVKQLPCAVCNAPGPSDAHHCIHKPMHGEQGLYNRTPCAGRKSHDRDTIPLCKSCHQDGPGAIHRGASTWKLAHGPDYKFIAPTRAKVAAMQGEIDF